MQKTTMLLTQNYEEYEVVYLDLADYKIEFSDGRPYHEYDGDTKYVTETLMNADAIVIGTPIFQASIPAPLKNIFDLLPFDAFLNKVVSIIVTAGTSKHYLMAEHQLKPILSFMKATIVPSIVFIEEKDFTENHITNEEIIHRLNCLIDETVLTVEMNKYKERFNLETIVE